MAHCVSVDLNFCNVRNRPTFRTKAHQDVLNLTLVNRCVWDRVVGWHVGNILDPSRMTHILGSRFKLESKHNLKCYNVVMLAGTSMYTNSNKN